MSSKPVTAERLELNDGFYIAHIVEHSGKRACDCWILHHPDGREIGGPWSQGLAEKFAAAMNAARAPVDGTNLREALEDVMRSHSSAVDFIKKLPADCMGTAGGESGPEGEPGWNIVDEFLHYAKEAQEKAVAALSQPPAGVGALPDGALEKLGDARASAFEALGKNDNALEVNDALDSIQAVIQALAAHPAPVQGWRPDTVRLIDEWLDTETMKLRAGELTAGEVRAVKAVLNSIKASLTPPPAKDTEASHAIS